MQKILIALTFALAITTAFGTFTALSAWPKTLQNVGVDGNSSFTNTTTGIFGLYTTNTGEISLLNVLLTNTNQNLSMIGWTAYWKKIDTKVITGGANSSVAWTAPSPAFTLLGYIISLNTDNSSGIPLLKAYQQPLAGGATVTTVIGSNTNATWQPFLAGLSYNGKTVYAVYVAANQKLNITSFTLGGAASTTEYTIPTSNYDSMSFAAAMGEALKSTQVWALWTENGMYKDALIDLSSGTVTANAVGVNTSYKCQPYSTDKKWYGTFCQQTVSTTVNGTTTSTLQTYVRNNTSPLTPLFNYNATVNTITSLQPYGPYLAIFFANAVNGTTTYSYELWNLDTLAIYNTSSTPSRVNFLSVDGSSTFSQVRLPAGGIYGLVYNNVNVSNPNSTISNISVGVLLGSSYLTTVFGFIMTIIAGLFLF